MSDDRASRLRDRRRQARERAEPDESDEPSETSETDEPAKPSKPDEMSETDEPSKQSETSVKDEQVGTYMYLPEAQAKELSRQFNVLKAEYEFEFDEAFEKNRAFYPLVVEHGLSSLRDMSAAELRAALEKLDQV